MDGVQRFHWADYLVFGIFLSASAGIGFFFGWKDRNKTSAKEFLTGGKNMHWIPVAFSMQASFLSAIFILSTPLEFYYFGTTFYYLFLTYIIALPISAHIFLSLFYKLNLVSAYEYLEIRFNRTVRIAGAATFCLMVLLYNSVILYTPAIALAQATGLPIDVSILLCGSICTLYTVMGGMKATIWIDFVQMVIVFAGLLCIVIIGCLRVGGIDKVWQINEDGGRIIFNDFRIDPTIRTTFWTQFIGGSYISFSLYTSSQTIIQKFISVDSLKNAYKSIYLDVFTSLIFITLVGLVGIISYAFYATCDPLSSNRINKNDQLVPLLVMELLSPYPGLPGIFIATTFSAALSSLSGSLNALAAVIMTDFICPFIKWLNGHDLKERKINIFSRLLVLLFGVIAIGSGYVAQYLGESVLRISISIFGFVGGPLTAILVLGVCLPFVNSWGAITGLIASLVVTSWMAIGSILSKIPLPLLDVSIDGCPPVNSTNHFSTEMNFNETVTLLTPRSEEDISWFYRISNFYYAPVSLIIAMIVAIPVSLITGRAENTNPDLTISWNCFKIFFKNKDKEYNQQNIINQFPYEQSQTNQELKSRNRKLDQSTRF